MARDTIGEGIQVKAVHDLKRGNLLFMPGHVVIYAGAGSVIHADGKTMIVRRQSLAEMMDIRRVGFSDMLVRRV